MKTTEELKALLYKNETVADAAPDALQAAQVGCLGLDFNSGVESAPGQKDAHKIAAAFGALRQL